MVAEGEESGEWGKEEVYIDGAMGGVWKWMVTFITSSSTLYKIPLLSLSTFSLFFSLSLLSFFPFLFPLAKRGNDSIYSLPFLCFLFFTLLLSSPLLSSSPPSSIGLDIILYSPSINHNFRVFFSIS